MFYESLIGNWIIYESFRKLPFIHTSDDYTHIFRNEAPGSHCGNLSCLGWHHVPLWDFKGTFLSLGNKGKMFKCFLRCLYIKKWPILGKIQLKLALFWQRNRKEYLSYRGIWVSGIWPYPVQKVRLSGREGSDWKQDKTKHTLQLSRVLYTMTTRGHLRDPAIILDVDYSVG